MAIAGIIRVSIAIAKMDCVCTFIVGAITFIVGAVRASRRVRSNAPTGIVGNDHNPMKMIGYYNT